MVKVRSQCIVKVVSPTIAEKQGALCELLRTLINQTDHLVFPMTINIEEEVEGKMPSSTTYTAEVKQ